MRKIRTLWLLAMVCGFSSGQTSAVSQTKKPLFTKLRQRVQQSVIFVRLSDRKVLFQRNPAQSLIPASVTKLITSAASLYHLGPQYKFQTSFLHTGSRKGHIINGDLIIIGSGDPLFISEKLWQAAADLRHMGIRTITGDIIIDNSLFDGNTRDPSRLAGKKHSIHAYDAPLTAFGINFNTFAIAMAPGERVGAKGIVGLDPYSVRGLYVENKLRTAGSHAGSSSRVSRYSGKNGDTRMIVSGMIPRTGQLKKVYRSVGDPVTSAGEQVRSFLNKEGIIIQGQVVSAKAPAGAQLLLTVDGYPMKKIVESLNKYSNNYIADVLVKKLATKDSASPGSLAGGLNVLRAFMTKKVGITPGFRLENGSGLSPKNRLSAKHLGNLLVFMESRFDLFPEYLNSLPSAGYDGTMEDRFRNSSLRGVVRAKTGTLTAPVTVASLAGYLKHKNHGLVAFAMIENGVVGRAQPGLIDLRNRQDKAIQRFINTY